VATSSSNAAKKVAKQAQRGKGKTVRFQGGTLFPAIIVVVLVVGLVLIGYSRQTVPDPGSFPPQQGDHWHAAYGMYVCDGWLPKLTGNKEETTTDAQGNKVAVYPLFQTTGIHSHEDGVIHWHPYSSKSVGKRAVLGVFLDVYSVTLNTDELKLPSEQGGEEYVVGEYKCDGKDVEIKVVAWDNYTDTGKGQTYITDLTDIRVKQDGMVFTIAVVPPGTDVSMPPWAAELPELGLIDTTGSATPPTTVAPTGTTTAGSPSDTTTAPGTVTSTTGG
jgi:hypothetical protein